LCRRFEIDNSSRDLHGALLDCQLLAEVYLELSGGRQPGFDLDPAHRAAAAGPTAPPRTQRPARPHAPTAEELAAHEALVDSMKDPVWRQ
jgi:DNA polymerase-3 subunit epsilon